MPAITLAAGNNKAVHHNGEQCANRVDHDAFPAQDVGNRGFRAYDAQHWYDHGWSGDQGQGAEQQGHLPAKAEQVMRAGGDHGPGGQCTNRHHAPDHATNLAPLR